MLEFNYSKVHEVNYASICNLSVFLNSFFDEHIMPVGTDQTAIKENNNGSKPINKEEEAQYKERFLSATRLVVQE